MTPVQLRQQRTQLVERMRSIVDRAERENRDLNRTERRDYDQMRDEFDSLTGRIGRAEDQEARDLATARTIPTPDNPTGRGSLSDPDRGGEGLWLPSLREYREWRATSTDSAGVFVPDQQAGRWFDRIRTRSVVLSAGPMILPMDGKTLDVPKLAGSVSVATVDEGDPIPASDPTYDKITLTAHKLAALSYVTSEALDDSTPALREVVQADMEREFAGELDRQLLVGDGTGTNMTGIRNFSGVTELDPFGGENGGAPTLDELADMVATAEALGIDLDSLVWFMRPQVWNVVRKLKDNDDRYQLSPSPTTDARKRLFDVPVAPTSRLAGDETTGTSEDTSPVILSDMSRVAVGRRKEMQLKVSEDFAFDEDTVALRVIGRFDIQPTHPEGIIIRPGARVGA